MGWWLSVSIYISGQYSLQCVTLKAASAPAVEKTWPWAERAGLSFPPSLLVWDWRRWEASGIRVSPGCFFFSSNAAELRSLPLLTLAPCSTGLLHQKRKKNFDLDMPFFSVPCYNFCWKKPMIKCICGGVSPFREERMLLSNVFPKPLMRSWSPSWTVRRETRALALSPSPRCPQGNLHTCLKVPSPKVGWI